MRETIHNLVKVLETLEGKLDFTVFTYAFEFEGVYYEIDTEVLEFGYRGCKDVGDKLTGEEVVNLIKRLEEYGKRR